MQLKSGNDPADFCGLTQLLPNQKPPIDRRVGDADECTVMVLGGCRESFRGEWFVSKVAAWSCRAWPGSIVDQAEMEFAWRSKRHGSGRSWLKTTAS